jgi:hypothetical protein
MRYPVRLPRELFHALPATSGIQCHPEVRCFIHTEASQRSVPLTNYTFTVSANTERDLFSEATNSYKTGLLQTS